MSRAEKRIAVVSHSSFLRTCLGLFGKDFDDTIKYEIHSHFNNCEMRTMMLTGHGSLMVDSQGTVERMDYLGQALPN